MSAGCHMRHLLFAVGLVIYIVAIGQNWAVYIAAFAAATYIRHGGRLGAPVDSTRF